MDDLADALKGVQFDDPVQPDPLPVDQLPNPLPDPLPVDQLPDPLFTDTGRTKHTIVLQKYDKASHLDPSPGPDDHQTHTIERPYVRIPAQRMLLHPEDSWTPITQYHDQLGAP
eukprot:g76241.t1